LLSIKTEKIAAATSTGGKGFEVPEYLIQQRLLEIMLILSVVLV
jgi:hypothetical protein